MARTKANRKRRPLDRWALRGLETVFWIVFALAVGIAGPSAVRGLPQLGNVFVPEGPVRPVATASIEPQIRGTLDAASLPPSGG